MFEMRHQRSKAVSHAGWHLGDDGTKQCTGSRSPELCVLGGLECEPEVEAEQSEQGRVQERGSEASQGSGGGGTAHQWRDSCWPKVTWEVIGKF